MGWWNIESNTGVMGDDSADVITGMLYKLKRTYESKKALSFDMQEFINEFADSLKSTSPAHLGPNLRISARLSNGKVLFSTVPEKEDRSASSTIKTAIEELDSLYLDYVKRKPTLSEVFATLEFILGYQPERFLSGLDNIEVKGFDSVN